MKITLLDKEMNYDERMEWLEARFEKKVFHSELTCKCEVCQSSTKNGFIVTKENFRYWLDYTADMGLELKEEI